MTRTKTGVNLVLLAFLMVSVLLPTACSKAKSSDWVGTTPLEEALSNGKPTVAEFGSATCIPCKKMKPVLEELIAEHGDKLNLSFTDVRIHTSVAAKYRIVYMPTQVFFDSSGQEVSRHVGFWPREDVLAHLEESGLL
jgi:thioredoxin 1